MRHEHYLSEVELMKEFGDNLRSILDEFQMTQKELAEEMGVSETLISRYLSCERFPSLKAYVNLVAILDVDPDDLMDFDYFID